ncbi:MAG: GntR family transcriptional regulator [Chloroflexota bacterium]
MRSQEQPSTSNLQLAERAYRLIKQSIIRCELVPGSQVTEVQMVNMYGLGRAAVRSALKRLYQEGLVRPIARRGYWIAPVTIKQVYDLYEIRLMLEPAAVKLACERLSASELKQLEELSKAKYQIDDEESITGFLSANNEFHLRIVRAANNPRLAQILEALLDEMTRYFHLGLRLRNRAMEMLAEHDQLVKALLAADVELAERICVEQILASRKMVVDALLASPSIQETNLAFTADGFERADRPRLALKA